MPPKNASNYSYKPPRHVMFIHQDSDQITPNRKQKQKTKKTQSQNRQKPNSRLSTYTNPSNSQPKSINNKKNSLQKQNPQFRKQNSQNSKIFKAQTNFQKKMSQSTQPSMSNLSNLRQMGASSSQINNQVQSNIRTSTVQSRWNRPSQIGTQSRIVKQYQRFYDADNVFMQETSLMKWDAFINAHWLKILITFIVLGSIWLALFSIDKYEKPCPRHATCGAYINCHNGYILNRTHQICQIDPQVKQSAHAIMNSQIQDMKFEYGNKQCTIPINATEYQIQQHLAVPKRSLYSIFKRLQINDEQFQALRVILTDLFNDPSLQKIGKFKKDSLGNYYPQEKYYQISCRLNLFYERNFYKFVALCILLLSIVILSGYMIYRRLFNKKAESIYKYLKQKTIQRKEIYYQHIKPEIQNKFNNGRPISQQLYVLINNYRIEQQVIGCYQVTQSNNQWIVWRSLSSV